MIDVGARALQGLLDFYNYANQDALAGKRARLASGSASPQLLHESLLPADKVRWNTSRAFLNTTSGPSAKDTQGLHAELKAATASVPRLDVPDLAMPLDGHPLTGIDQDGVLLSE